MLFVLRKKKKKGGGILQWKVTKIYRCGIMEYILLEGHDEYDLRNICELKPWSAQQNPYCFIILS